MLSEKYMEEYKPNTNKSETYSCKNKKNSKPTYIPLFNTNFFLLGIHFIGSNKISVIPTICFFAVVYNKQIVFLYAEEETFVLKINIFLYFKAGFWYQVD